MSTDPHPDEQPDQHEHESDTITDEELDALEDDLERDQERVQIKGRGPKWMRDAINERDVTLTEAIVEGLRLYLGEGDIYESKIDALRRRNRELDDRDAEIDAEIRKLQNEKAEIEAEKRRNRDRIETLEEHRQESRAGYEQQLEEIEARIRDGMAVFPDHGAITEAAELGGVDAVDVIEELQERNPEIPERAFKNQTAVNEPWDGVDSGLRLRSERDD